LNPEQLKKIAPLLNLHEVCRQSGLDYNAIYRRIYRNTMRKKFDADEARALTKTIRRIAKELK